MRATLLLSFASATCLAVACSSSSGPGSVSDGGAGSAGSAGTASDGGCDTTTAANCGFCGNACASFQTCTAGVCTSGQTCPGPIAGASAQAVAAYGAENDARAAAGVPCATLVATIDTAAADHCAYYAANAGSSKCDGDAHVEVSGCKDYVAAQFYDRMSAAGYTGQAAFEDMAFLGDGAGAAQEWIDSVWHRVPVLSPWIRDIGYGSATGCDTMDFGVGASSPASVTAVYPYPGQAGLPSSFNGAEEGPIPPVPPAGWPSGYPITVYLKGAKSASVHTITVLGSAAPLDHQIISPGDAAADGLLTDEFVLYTNAPLAAATHYHVHVEATGAGGAATFDWVFTTK